MTETLQYYIIFIWTA